MLFYLIPGGYLPAGSCGAQTLPVWGGCLAGRGLAQVANWLAVWGVCLAGWLAGWLAGCLSWESVLLVGDWLRYGLLWCQLDNNSLHKIPMWKQKASE